MSPAPPQPRSIGQFGSELVAEAQLSRVLLDASPDCVKLLDLTGHLEFMSAPGLRLLGVDDFASVRGRDWAAMRPDEAVSVARGAIAAARAGEIGRFQERWTVPAGASSWWDVNISPIRDDEGRVVKLLAVSRDITEMKRAEEALLESVQHYRSLVDHHPDAVFSFDTTGRFLSANPTFEAMSGYSSAELVGESFAPLVVTDHAERVQAHFQAAVSGSGSRYEAAIRHRSGRRVETGMTNIPILVDRRVVGVFGIAKDLTAQRELETQLRQKQKMEAVGQLAGGVAHDFNNLLTVIKANTEVVLDELAEDHPLRVDLDEVHKATNRAAALTRQLLAFSRQQVLQPRHLDVNAVIVDLQRMLARLIGEDIDFTLDLGRDLGGVLVDPGQLEQVLVNLVVNARDAMPNGGDLIIATRNVELSAGEALRHGAKPGLYVAVAIRDTGMGMSADMQARIFEPFFTTKEVGQGTGLGLATVHGIMLQSGGFVDTRSTPGRGTVFTLFLPLVANGEAAVRTHAAVRASRSPGTETVLVVEDEDTVRESTRRVLTRHGYTVLEASNGVEALTLFAGREGPIDVVLSDAVMPQMSGPELASRLAELRPGLPVIIMSGYTDDDLMRRGAIGSATPFLQKPFSAERLLGAVRDTLDRPGDGRRTARRA
jgi:PAS domain S-box-containing protein